jgi:adenylate cyclase
MPPIRTEEDFRLILTGERPGFDRSRRLLERIPSPPRCKLCAAPFAGAGGAVLQHLGYRRFAGNPQLCENCIRGYSNREIRGAEVTLSLLFADIRGSTALGEQMRPAEFRAFLEHFYRIGSEVVLHHGGLVDKLVGDEVVALFIGGIAGRDRHAAAAVAAGRDLLTRVGVADATPSGPIPVGAGVHTGEAYVGIVGDEAAAMDFTALGDPVNTTARLASTAAAGELLITADAARAAGIDASPLEHRRLDVRGRTEPVDVLVESFATSVSAS